MFHTLKSRSKFRMMLFSRKVHITNFLIWSLEQNKNNQKNTEYIKIKKELILNIKVFQLKTLFNAHWISMTNSESRTPGHNLQ